nr:NAD(P)H-dependent oxidoreductase [Brevundimonas viscosa]
MAGSCRGSALAERNDSGPAARGRLGRSARVIVTMGMPALIYRTGFIGYSLASLKRGVLGLVGFRPVRDMVIGGVESRRDHEQVLARVGQMGARGI